MELNMNSCCDFCGAKYAVKASLHRSGPVHLGGYLGHRAFAAQYIRIVSQRLNEVTDGMYTPCPLASEFYVA